jgi:hypothetical protein
MKLMKRITLIAGLFFFFLLPLMAAPSNDMETRGKYLTVKISVAGPGDELYFWWGHIGILIEDSLTGQSKFYDWGIFSFDTENFFSNFAFGRLYYNCGVSDAGLQIAYMAAQNRDITLYTLNLPPKAKAELYAFAEEIVLPENRFYQYHHFDNNCATKVRDIIDDTLGGSLKERFFEEPGRFTLREHVRRHTWFSPFWDWLLNFWMGQGIDEPITVWEEMFLPSEIAAHISEFTYTDIFGREQQLVSNIEVLNTAKDRHVVLEDPPSAKSLHELAVGLCIAGLFGFLRLMTGLKNNNGTEEKRHTFFRQILGISQTIVGLFFGLVGLLLFFMAFFTNHDYTFHNINVLFVNPLILIAVPAGLVYAFSRNSKKRLTAEVILVILWNLVSLAGLATIAIKLLPGFYQQNQPSQALVLPFALILGSIPGWIFRLFTPKKR